MIGACRCNSKLQDSVHEGGDNQDSRDYGQEAGSEAYRKKSHVEERKEDKALRKGYRIARLVRRDKGEVQDSAAARVAGKGSGDLRLSFNQFIFERIINIHYRHLL